MCLQIGTSPTAKKVGIKKIIFIGGLIFFSLLFLSGRPRQSVASFKSYSKVATDWQNQT